MEKRTHLPPQSAAEQALTFFLRSPGMREKHAQHVAHGLYALMAADTSLMQMAPVLMKPYQSFTVMKAFAESIHAIDDRIDTMSPEQLLAVGEAKLGVEPSPFLTHPEIFHPEEFLRAKAVVDLGLCSKEEGIAFANLAAVLVQEEAKQIIKYQDKPSPKNRRAILEADRKITDVLLTVIVNWFHHSDHIQQCLDQTHQLKYDDIIPCFPDVLKIFRAYEIMDDYRDFLQDLQQEIKTGRPVANYFLTKLHERGELFDKEGNIQKIFTKFIK